MLEFFPVGMMSAGSHGRLQEESSDGLGDVCGAAKSALLSRISSRESNPLA
ncbi:MAG: hypothetical protein AB1607_13860 [Chloroflexota bacterium]